MTHTRQDSEHIHGYFNASDTTTPTLPCVDEVLRWLHEDMERTVEDVVDLDIQREIREISSSNSFKRFEPTNNITYTLHFADGMEATKRVTLPKRETKEDDR